MFIKLAEIIDHHPDNLVQNVFLVKEEHEIDLGDGDQFYDDYNYEPAHSEEDNNDPLIGDHEDDDSDFCITPSSQKRSKKEGRKLIKKKSSSSSR